MSPFLKKLAVGLVFMPGAAATSARLKLFFEFLKRHTSSLVARADVRDEMNGKSIARRSGSCQTNET